MDGAHSLPGLLALTVHQARQSLDALPKVTYYTMGANRWQTSDTWPPAGAEARTFYLSSGGNANTIMIAATSAYHA